MKPLPWSPTSLSDFENCNRSFYEQRVLKKYKTTQTPEMLWGNRVHKAFELYVRDGTPLPSELETHQEKLDELIAFNGEHFTERRVGLNTSGLPCEFFAPDVWERMVIDFHKIHVGLAVVVDYKTGKQKDDFDQLKLNALWIFAMYPQVNYVEVKYYWTKTKTFTYDEYKRTRIPELWAVFLPKLRRYANAFKTDTWPPKPSGLCNGWCPVTTCEFWRPRRHG